MNIWILAKKRNFRTYENRSFLQEAKKMNISVKLVAPEEIEIIEPILAERKILYKNKLVDLPDCLIPRTGSGSTPLALAVVRFFERLGVLVLNTALSIEDSKDKFRAIQLLSAKNLPLPKTMLAKLPLNMRFIKKQFHFPIVLKKISGSMGKGVVLCENTTQMEDVLGIAESSFDGSTNIILQEFISASRGKDIRVWVIGGRAIGAMLRMAQTGKFKANYSAGGSVENFPLNADIEWLAIESARVLGLEIAGIDILFDKDGYRICEVNSAPFFKGFAEATAINIPHEIFHFVQVRLEGRVIAIPTPTK